MARPTSKAALTVRVTTSAEAAARDAAAIASGVPSRALMQRAGAAAAGEIARRFPYHLATGVLIYAGPGNNGGDAWVVARALAAAGIDVTVCEPVESKAPDASAERALALPRVARIDWLQEHHAIAERRERLVIDGLLGTGSAGPARGPIGEAITAINGARRGGAVIVALDVPSGVDATTGMASHAVVAHLTLTFATIKRGLLVARDHCGTLAVLDIGLEDRAAGEDEAPPIIDARWVRTVVPPIAAGAHKGTRKRLVIVGGADGMAGATLLAARGALRSGIGMVKLVVAPGSLPIVQEAEPAALASCWPADPTAVVNEIATWADAVAVGPGLGRGRDARQLVERLLGEWRGPVVLDADALTVFADDAASLREMVDGRPALLTPHPAEFARLGALPIDDVLARRFDVGRDLAARCGATILLKGQPTVVTAPAGRRLISAAGTPALATAGSGDLLTGIAATLLAQTDDPLSAGAAAAWIHGRAAELAHGAPDVERRTARGIALDDVIAALPGAWQLDLARPSYPVLFELAAVGEYGSEETG